MDELKPIGTAAPATKAPRLPAQRTWLVKVTDWADYDVPRMWDSLACLSHEETWGQAQHMARQSDQLKAQADALQRLRERLAAAWSGGQTSAAAAALLRLDLSIDNLRADGFAAATTARGVNGVLEAMASAKRRLEPIVREYLGITGEHHIYAWRVEATRLNEQARQVMFETEAVIADHRKNIVVPMAVDVLGVIADPPLPPSDTRPGNGGPWRNQPDGSNSRPSSPVMPSVQRPAPDWPSGGPAADDEGEPLPDASPVPRLSTSGASVLPVFPGSTYAPQGGAYVMPTHGAADYFMPMPNGPGVAPSARGVHGGSAAGLMPVPTPMGTPTPSRGGEGAYYRRGADTRWEVRQGGRSVIEPDAYPASPESAESRDMNEFREWYTEVAMPWRLGSAPEEPAPTVVIRRGAP